jgi:hypothetical protein
MRRRSKYLIIYLILINCATTCKKNTGKPVVEIVAGVMNIHNTPGPQHPNMYVVFEEEFTYNGYDERDGDRLFNPGNFTVDLQGNMYIEDSSDMAIKSYDEQGKYIRTIGRKGNGPGEFAGIGDIITLPDGRLLVNDFQARRTSFFGQSGKFLTSFQWKRDFGRIYLATDSSYTLEEIVFAEKKQRLYIRTIAFSGEEIMTLGQFHLPETKMFRLGDNIVRSVIPWSPASVFAGDPKRQWVYHCPGDKYLIEVYDEQGKLFRKIDRPYKPVSVTDEDVTKFKSRFADKPNSPAAKIYQQMELPKIKPIIDRVLVDNDGKLWAKTSEVEREDGKERFAYEIINEDGFYSAKVWVDINPHLFASGKMYSFAEDRITGMRHIKRYRITWKAN